ncbi:GNAT family protein [Mesorhizobium sp. M0243]|uniref:GNAT family N-acetyltransferase n=1 Tax=Mesorhizobium sp. M0243 TaxID=2956925 RepID=UPI0033374CAA
MGIPGIDALRNPGNPGWFQFALERNEDRRIVGDSGLKTFEADTRLAQIGSTRGQQYWNHSYATDAARSLIECAFYNFPHSPQHCVLSTGAVRVLEESGFVKEAHFRLSEWFKGVWTDDAIYALRWSRLAAAL